jgi:hypothetical protein
MICHTAHFLILLGIIPKRYLKVKNVDILTGNVFQCHGLNDVPENDPSRETYVCGSNNLDTSILVWISVFGACAMFIAICGVIIYNVAFIAQPSGEGHASGGDGSRGKLFIYQIRMQWTTLCAWHHKVLSIEKESPSSVFLELHHFIIVLRRVCKITVLLATYIAIAYGIFYVIIKQEFDMGSHSHQYRWLYSGAYLSGVPAAVCMLLLLLIAIVIFDLSIGAVSSNLKLDSVITPSVNTSARPHSVDTSSSSPPPQEIASNRFNIIEATQQFLRKYCYVMLAIVLDIVIVSVMKGVYVFLLLSDGITPTSKLLMQMCLALFDICWNSLVVTEIVDLLRFTLPSPDRARLRLFVLLFNSIIAPMISVAVTDRNCFVSLFKGAEEITSSGQYDYCSLWDTELNICLSSITIDLTTYYYPPFTYQYQCTSALLANFIPVFLYSYTLVTFVLPVVYAFRFISHSTATMPRPSVVMSDMIHFTVVLLSFGTAAPVLAVVIACASASSFMRHYIAIGRYLTLSETAEQVSEHGPVVSGVLTGVQQKKSDMELNRENSRDEYGPSIARSSHQKSKNSLETACQHMWQAPQLAKSIVVWSACMFFVCLGFDIAGDTIGWSKSILVIVIPGLCMATLTQHIIPAIVVPVWLKCNIDDSRRIPATVDTRTDEKLRRNGSPLVTEFELPQHAENDIL